MANYTRLIIIEYIHISQNTLLFNLLYLIKGKMVKYTKNSGFLMTHPELLLQIVHVKDDLLLIIILQVVLKLLELLEAVAESRPPRLKDHVARLLLLMGWQGGVLTAMADRLHGVLAARGIRSCGVLSGGVAGPKASNARSRNRSFIK